VTAEPRRAPVALRARDRWTLLIALAALTALAWAYLKWSPMPMPASSGGLRTTHYLVVTFLMWLVMMVGMMTPSVAPTVLLFDRVARRGAPGGTLARTVPFVAGYLLAWLAFSVAATLLQIELIATGWIDAMGVAARPWVTAALLTAVGIYQWLPAKRACLDHCRSPVQFLVDAYRPGTSGALLMGLQHGLYCLGCCWALMLLLFVGGVMNLLWVAGIAALVFVEKLLARGDWLRRAIGVAALAAAATVPVFQNFQFG
jgi:predicted metal-binding membrane protein